MSEELDREQVGDALEITRSQYLDALAILLGPLPYGERFICGMTPAISSALANTIGIRLSSDCWAADTEAEHAGMNIAYAECTCRRRFEGRTPNKNPQCKN
jgi:hypothetical protein